MLRNIFSMRRTGFAFLTIGSLFFVSLISGCNSAPEYQQGGDVPEWVVSPPSSSGGKTWFVGSGRSGDKSFSEAEEFASDDLIAEITQYLGVRITSETNARARATLDDLSTEIERSVRSTGSARVTGFRIEERWSSEEAGATVVYILASYNTSDLEEEKARLTSLFREQQEAVSGPEADGDALMKEGRAYKAAVKYLEAAEAAAVTTLENAGIKFTRNLNKAEEALSLIRTEKLNDNLQGEAAVPFAQPFRLRVTSGSTAGTLPLADVSLRVTYREKRSNGRLAVKTATLLTDKKGEISFLHPVPTFVGAGQLSMEIDLSGSFDSVIQALEGDYSRLSAVEDAALNLKRVFDYTVVSRARSIPSAILVVDADRTKAAYGTQDTASGLLMFLSEAQFDVKRLDLPAEFLLSASDSEILERVRQETGGSVERLIYGVASIEDFEETEGNYLVKVSATLKVAELETGRIVYSGNLFKRARGSRSQSAIASGFRQLGESFGEEMASQLP